MRRVSLTRFAEIDLEAIDTWARAEWPRRAQGFMDRLERRILRLAIDGDQAGHHPYIGPPLRRIVHERHAIFSQVTDDEVRVVAVLHGARDLQTILAARGHD